MGWAQEGAQEIVNSIMYGNTIDFDNPEGTGMKTAVEISRAATIKNLLESDWEDITNQEVDNEQEESYTAGI